MSIARSRRICPDRDAERLALHERLREGAGRRAVDPQRQVAQRLLRRQAEALLAQDEPKLLPERADDAPRRELQSGRRSATPASTVVTSRSTSSGTSRSICSSRSRARRCTIARRREVPAHQGQHRDAPKKSRGSSLPRERRAGARRPLPAHVARTRVPTNDATDVWYMPAELSSSRSRLRGLPEPFEAGERPLAGRWSRVRRACRGRRGASVAAGAARAEAVGGDLVERPPPLRLRERERTQNEHAEAATRDETEDAG